MALDLIARKPEHQASHGLIAFTDSSLVTELLMAAMTFPSASSREFSATYSAHETNIYCDKGMFSANEGKYSSPFWPNGDHCSPRDKASTMSPPKETAFIFLQTEGWEFTGQSGQWNLSSICPFNKGRHYRYMKFLQE